MAALTKTKGLAIMSVTREAVIFYGYVFDPDEYLDNSPDTTIAARKVIAANGVANPWDGFTENMDRHAFYIEHRSEINTYISALIDAEGALPVYAGTHGSNAVPTPFLCVAGTSRNTPRGTQRAVPSQPPIPLDGRPVDPAWKTVLEEFLTSQDITPPAGENQPGWWSAAFEDRD